MISSFVRALVSVFKARRELALENLALRQQLAVLRRSVKRPRLSNVDREFWVLLWVLPRRVQKYKRTQDPRVGLFRKRSRVGWFDNPRAGTEHMIQEANNEAGLRGVRHFRGPGESTRRSERPKIPPSDH